LLSHGLPRSAVRGSLLRCASCPMRHNLSLRVAFCQATLEPSSQGVRIKTDTWCTLMRASHTPYASHLRHMLFLLCTLAISRSPADLHISDVVFRPALSTKQRLPATSRLESRTILVGRLSKQARNCTPAANKPRQTTRPLLLQRLLSSVRWPTRPRPKGRQTLFCLATNILRNTLDLPGATCMQTSPRNEANAAPARCRILQLADCQ